jgi:hypothetical protein
MLKDGLAAPMKGRARETLHLEKPASPGLSEVQPNLQNFLDDYDFLCDHKGPLTET